MFKDKFDGNLYSSHGKSKSCGILIGFSGNKTFTIYWYDKNGQILILETLMTQSLSVLIFTMQIQRVKT